MFAGSYCIPLKIVYANGGIDNYPYTIFREPIELNKGTKYSTAMLEGTVYLPPGSVGIAEWLGNKLQRHLEHGKYRYLQAYTGPTSGSCDFDRGPAGRLHGDHHVRYSSGNLSVTLPGGVTIPHKRHQSRCRLSFRSPTIIEDHMGFFTNLIDKLDRPHRLEAPRPASLFSTASGSGGAIRFSCGGRYSRTR